ncbi:MAG: STAS domain-containing protein [Bacteroidia bacterium]|nr:STAS domain-containing protein [Bacteroidia bacterium]
MDFLIEKSSDFTSIRVLDNELISELSVGLKSRLVLIAGSGEQNMILDISNCTYCDSSGLSAIRFANTLCRNAGGRFILSGLQPEVKKLFDISQLGFDLQTAGNMQEAVEMFSKEGIE